MVIVAKTQMFYKEHLVKAAVYKDIFNRILLVIV